MFSIECKTDLLLIAGPEILSTLCLLPSTFFDSSDLFIINNKNHNSLS